MADTKEMKDYFTRMYETSMNEGEFTLAREWCDTGFSCENPDYEISGHQGIVDSIEMQRDRLDNFHFEIEFLSVSEDCLALAWKITGRHVKEMYEVPPSGKDIEVRGLSLHELVDGKSIGGWSNSDYVPVLEAAYESAKAEGKLPVSA